MSLPTSGFATSRINYLVTTGDTYNANINIVLDRYGLGSEAHTEAVMAVLEPALISLAADFAAADGNTYGDVLRGFDGSAPTTIIS